MVGSKTRLVLLLLVAGGVLGTGAARATSGWMDDAGDDHHAPPARSASKATPAKPAVAPPKDEPAHAVTTTPTPRASRPGAKPPAASASAPAPDARLTPDGALKLLQEGNQRWVSGQSTDPNTEPSRRQMLAEQGSHPFAIVLTCADSRLPAERIFDRGTGDLFVVRVAGNVAGTSETGTVQYGVGHLKAPLLVVMGHSKCGAVAAAASGAEAHGKLADLLTNIAPAVDRARKANPEAEGATLVAAAIKENVWQTIFDLIKFSPEVRRGVESGELKVIGAVCDIATGKVEWMGEHPWQAELVAAMNARAERDATAEGGSHTGSDH